MGSLLNLLVNIVIAFFAGVLGVIVVWRNAKRDIEVRLLQKDSEIVNAGIQQLREAHKKLLESAAADLQEKGEVRKETIREIINPVMDLLLSLSEFFDDDSREDVDKEDTLFDRYVEPLEKMLGNSRSSYYKYLGRPIDGLFRKKYPLTDDEKEYLELSRGRRTLESSQHLEDLAFRIRYSYLSQNIRGELYKTIWQREIYVEYDERTAFYRSEELIDESIDRLETSLKQIGDRLHHRGYYREVGFWEGIKLGCKELFYKMFGYDEEQMIAKYEKQLAKNEVSKAIREMKREYLHQRQLGIHYIPLTAGIANERNLPIDHGALLQDNKKNPAVVPGSIAEKFGLRAGDVIVGVNEDIIDEQHFSLKYLIDVLRKNNNIPVTLRVWRNGAVVPVRMGRIFQQLT
ncbi:MAG: PDZ domain-containing protein [Patescibacteria group bacterium]|nr:PDZ domain-containing protein [Patescibacteria group bacterium]